jgi:hypothetical protein
MKENVVGAALRRPPNRFGRGKPLAQTGFFIPGHCPIPVAPGQAAPTGNIGHSEGLRNHLTAQVEIFLAHYCAIWVNVNV